MTDLDFDELDKAVNSLISTNSSAPKPASDEMAEKTLDITSTLSGDEKPPFDAVERTAQKASQDIQVSSTAKTTSSPTPAMRRGGRFMDVMHSSGNSRPTAPRLGLTPRQGVAIQPQSDLSDQPKTENPPTLSHDASDTPSESNLSNGRTASNWPDPIDFSKSSGSVNSYGDESASLGEPYVQTAKSVDPPSEKVQPEAETESGDDDINQIADDIDEIKQSDETPGSPFLPDAKVEKRPLGAFSDSATDQAESAPSISDTNLSDLSQSLDTNGLAVEPKEDPVEVQTTADNSLPRELQGDLLSVEASSVGDSPESDIETAKNTSPLAATSIPLQYKEQPSSSQPSSSAIYDTEAYPQPLNFPAKKGHDLTWLWIILIVAVFGGAVFAIIYFFDPLNLI